MGNNQNGTDEVDIDLVELFYILRSKILIILLATVVFAAASGLVSKFLISPVYASTAKLYILTQSTSLTSLADIQIGTSLTQDYMELIKSSSVVEKVIENLNLDMTYEAMLQKLSVRNPENTRILCITIMDTDPKLAKEIVDEFAMVSIDSISEIMAADKPNIVDEGHIADYPTNPNIKKNTTIGAFVGLFLSCVFIIVIHLLDDTIRSTDDMERYLGLNILAIIPMGMEENQIKEKRFFGKKKNRTKQKKKEGKKNAERKKRRKGGNRHD